MSEPANIELFDTFTAKIFALLYERFPLRVPLDATKLADVRDFDDCGVPLDAHGRPSREFEVCRATIAWLRDAGYIDCQGESAHGWGGCVLTARGLEVLKSMPESLQRKESIGERLVRLVRAEAMDLAREVARAAISMGVSLLR